MKSVLPALGSPFSGIPILATQRKHGVGERRLAKPTAPASSARMSKGLGTLRHKKASSGTRTRSAKPRKTAIRIVKLDLDVEELALHAAVSAAVARDLGR